jgi:hypothetical protein
MTGGTSRHRDALAALPHYHVIAENHDDELIYSDGFDWPCAQGFCADLISPPAGAPIHEPVKAVWIVVTASRLTSRRPPDFLSK